MKRPLSHIAQEILRTWTKPSAHALPYIRAMHKCTTLDDHYGADSAESVVRYFLSNAATWRGADARRIKAELHTLLSERTKKAKRKA